ncbi:MAG: hypothetical protein GF308_17425 [Candidatus Heimdallarchaeota archaeon]|nr:hypothetical protein [Candidatus Heimdallarchaeota archaeon]
MDRIRILGLTDLHSNGQVPLDRLKKTIQQKNINLIIITGDLSTFGGKKIVKKILEAFNRLEKPILYIPGNMDQPETANIQFGNIIPVHERSQKIHNIYFIGIGGSNETPFVCPFTLTETEIQQALTTAYGSVPNGSPFILLTHAPPKDSEADRLKNGQHVGSKIIRTFIEEKRPILVLCGHIHEAQSISQINGITCINPGPAAHGNATIIDLELRETEILVANAELIHF